jgi:hypothetical protein
MSRVLTHEEFDKIVTHYYSTEGICIYNAIKNDDGTYTFEFHAPACSSEYTLTMDEIDNILGNVL